MGRMKELYNELLQANNGEIPQNMKGLKIM